MTAGNNQDLGKLIDELDEQKGGFLLTDKQREHFFTYIFGEEQEREQQAIENPASSLPTESGLSDEVLEWLAKPIAELECVTNNYSRGTRIRNALTAGKKFPAGKEREKRDQNYRQAGYTYLYELLRQETADTLLKTENLGQASIVDINQSLGDIEVKTGNKGLFVLKKNKYHKGGMVVEETPIQFKNLTNEEIAEGGNLAEKALKKQSKGRLAREGVQRESAQEQKRVPPKDLTIEYVPVGEVIGTSPERIALKPGVKILCPVSGRSPGSAYIYQLYNAINTLFCEADASDFSATLLPKDFKGCYGFHLSDAALVKFAEICKGDPEKTAAQEAVPGRAR